MVNRSIISIVDRVKELLRENDNINDLEDFIAAYTEGTFESEESFLDQIKNCNL